MDPVTRVEGHLKVEIAIEQVNGLDMVADARCTGTLFRGFETILNGRDPWDAAVLTQRICGVCPISHAMTSVLALESTGGFKPPTNARILRNLTLGANYVQSHILHFYLLAALDYVKGPATTPFAPAWNVDLRPGLESVASHLPLAIEARRRSHEMGAVFGGKMPSSHAFIPGGFTAEVTEQAKDVFAEHLNWLINFINDVYLPDVRAVANAYPDYYQVGAGSGNLLSYGVFDTTDSSRQKLLPAGFVEQAYSENPQPVSDRHIIEHVRHSWYRDNGGLAPTSGVTDPLYPKAEAYSWLKAPRYLGKSCEVGPLARMWVRGDYRGGVSVMDRHAARAWECGLVAENMKTWLGELQAGGDTYAGFQVKNAFGVGLTEAPRGALGHWIEVVDGKIAHYQIVTPTCWNASPKDDFGRYGPMEEALVGTPIEFPDQPIEALRIIHSFDPCLSCAVHVIRPGGEVQVLSSGPAV
jgi:hydrogenase large subunit